MESPEMLRRIEALEKAVLFLHFQEDRSKFLVDKEVWFQGLLEVIQQVKAKSQEGTSQ